MLGSTGHREASQFTEERELDWTRGPEQDKMPSLGLDQTPNSLLMLRMMLMG